MPSTPPTSSRPQKAGYSNPSVRTPEDGNPELASPNPVISGQGPAGRGDSRSLRFSDTDGKYRSVRGGRSLRSDDPSKRGAGDATEGPRWWSSRPERAGVFL